MAKNNEVIMDVDGKPVILRLGFNGLIELEDELDMAITEISDSDIAFKDLRTIFYVAIRQGGKRDITPEETGNMLDTVMEKKGLDYLGVLMEELFNKMAGGQGDSFPTT